MKGGHNDNSTEDTRVLKHHLKTNFHDQFFPVLRAENSSS